MLLLHYGRPSVCTVRMMSEMLTPLSDSRHTKAEGKFTPQICRSRIFVPANECTRVVPMYPSQSAMSHLHSLAQSMYIATFLPKHVIPTCFADYVTSTSGAIRLAFDLSPWPQVHGHYVGLRSNNFKWLQSKKNPGLVDSNNLERMVVLAGTKQPL